jgi:D-alanine-D-alanine ligase
MIVGLSYDLKDSIPPGHDYTEDALEEYDSPETVNAIAAAIETMGHPTVKLGGGMEFLTNIVSRKVDLVFNIAEGLGTYRSREAQVPSILEMLDIPYSGSDPQCLTISLDKPLAKKLLMASGVTTPQWHLISYSNQLNEINWNQFPLPAFIKPAYEGSSKGITSGSIATSIDQIITVVSKMIELYRQPVLVEQFIAGDEVTVGVVGNSPARVLGIMRILPKQKTENFIYCLEVKRDWVNRVDYECPARLDKKTLEKIEVASLKIFQVLGCRDFSRIDFKISSSGEPYFLEINPLAGLNPKSGDLPIMAGKMGWTHVRLILAIFDAAVERYPQCRKK